MKKLFTLVLACVACTSMVIGSEKIGDLYYEYSSYYDGSGYIACFNVTSNPDKYTGKVVIPATVEYNGQTYPVKMILNYAFQECYELTEVEIAEGIVSLGYRAFYKCGNLKSVSLPEGLTNIGGDAFSECHSLSAITLPSSLETIGGYAFNNCDVIREVVIPNSVTSMGGGAFKSCDNLTAITLSENLTSIEGELFNECKKLSEIIIPNSVKTIGSYAFNNCPNLLSVTIGENVSSIGSSAFSNCQSLKEIQIPNSVIRIGSGAFDNCRELTEVVIPNSVSDLDGGVFYNCLNLLSVTLPEKLPTIKESMFAYCNSLRDIVIPNSVTSIGSEAFYSCRSLYSLTIPASVASIGNNALPSTITELIFERTDPYAVSYNPSFVVAYVPESALADYRAAWSDKSDHILPLVPDNHKEVAVSALSDKSAIHIALGDAELEKVTSLKVTGSINSYDIMIIRNKMVNLKELDLSEADIVANKYEYYTGQCSVDSVLTAHAFDNTHIKVAKLPASLKSIETNTFNAQILRELEVNGGMLAEQAFYNFSSLSKVTVRNCESIGRYCFTNCSKLQEVELGEPLSSIEYGAFSQCTNLRSVSLPATLQTIGDLAFYGTGLTAVTIPASVSKIGMFAFAGNSETGVGDVSNSYGIYHQIYFVEQHEDYIVYKGNTYQTNNTVIQADQDYLAVNGVLYPAKYQDSYYDESGSWHERGTYYYNGSEWVYYSYYGQDFIRFHSIFGQLGTIATYSLENDPYYTYYTPNNGFDDRANNRRSNGHLQSVVFENGSVLTEIGRSVFDGNEELREVVFPDSLHFIGCKAFAGCAMDSVVIPKSVFYVDNFAFVGAQSRKIVLPKALEEINPYTFYGCQSLQEVRVASTIRTIGDHAFDQCPNIKTVYTYTVEPTQINQNTFSCWKNADLYVPATSYYTYYYNTQWSQFLKLIEFDEAYDYFYVNEDYELGENGTIEGQPDADLNPGSGLIITGDNTQELGEITQSITESVSASIVACEQSLISSKLRIRVTMQSGVWYFLCFPFNLPLSSISWLGQFAIYEYDGSIRAANGSGGWVRNTASVLAAGKGYIIQSAVSGEIEFTVPNPVFSCDLFEQLLPVYSAAAAYDANWTLIGNPFPCYFDMDQLFTSGFNAPVYVRSKYKDDYDVYMPNDDEYHFHPYEAFFVQNPGDVASMINWEAAGRETLKQAQEKSAQSPARKRGVKDGRRFVELRLTADDQSSTDRTRVVFNDQAQADYELGRDAVKMQGSAPVRLYSLDSNTQYAINERPYDNGYVQLGFSVAKDGNYTLSASRLDTTVVIYDNVEKQEVDLSFADYHFFAKAGVDNKRFSIYKIKELVTSIDQLTGVFDSKVNVFTVSGVQVCDQVELRTVNLPAGVYVFQSDSKTRTVILK